MKKILCTLAVVGLAASAFAQGQINLTSGSNLVKNKDGVNVPKDGGFVELFWAPAGTAIAKAWTADQNATSWLAANTGWAAIPASIKAINGPVAGRFSAGTIDIPTATPGGSIDAIVGAWTGNYTSFDLAFAAGSAAQVGFSAPMLNIKTGNPLATPIPDLPTTTAGVFGGVTLATPGGTTVVPEPSSLALAGLGAAAMLIFRRRK